MRRPPTVIQGEIRRSIGKVDSLMQNKRYLDANEQLENLKEVIPRVYYKILKQGILDATKLERGELEHLCVQFEAAREQRETELARGEGTSGTSGYKKAGCYECDGKDKTKPCYWNTEWFKSQGGDHRE